MNADVKLDCFGLLCPMPIVKTSQKIKELKVGQVLEVTATDIGIKNDILAWCRVTGQKFLGIEEQGGEYRAYVEKTKSLPAYLLGNVTVNVAPFPGSLSIEIFPLCASTAHLTIASPSPTPPALPCST